MEARIWVRLTVRDAELGHCILFPSILGNHFAK